MGGGWGGVTRKLSLTDTQVQKKPAWEESAVVRCVPPAIPAQPPSTAPASQPVSRAHLSFLGAPFHSAKLSVSVSRFHHTATGGSVTRMLFDPLVQHRGWRLSGLQLGLGQFPLLEDVWRVFMLKLHSIPGCSFCP